MILPCGPFKLENGITSISVADADDGIVIAHITNSVPTIFCIVLLIFVLLYVYLVILLFFSKKVKVLLS
jgi:hypothetical protein